MVGRSDSAFGIVTRLREGHPRNCPSIPGRGKKMSLFINQNLIHNFFYADHFLTPTRFGVCVRHFVGVRDCLFYNTPKWRKQMFCKQQSTTPWKWLNQTSKRDRKKKKKDFRTTKVNINCWLIKSDVRHNARCVQRRNKRPRSLFIKVLAPARRLSKPSMQRKPGFFFLRKRPKREADHNPHLISKIGKFPQQRVVEENKKLI